MLLGFGQANIFQKSPQKVVKSRERCSEKWQLGGLRITNFSSDGVRPLSAQPNLPEALIAVISGHGVVINVGSGQSPNPHPARRNAPLK